MSGPKDTVGDSTSSSSSSENEYTPTQGGGGSQATQGSQVADGTQAQGKLGRIWRLTNAEMRILGIREPIKKGWAKIMGGGFQY